MRIHPLFTMAAVALAVVVIHDRYAKGGGRGMRVGA